MFEKYEVEGEIQIAVRADEIAQIIKMFDKDSTITFRKTKDNLLILSNRTEKYTLRVIEGSKNDCPLPEIIIEANNETEAIEKYLHETEYNEITVKKVVKKWDILLWIH